MSHPPGKQSGQVRIAADSTSTSFEVGALPQASVESTVIDIPSDSACLVARLRQFVVMSELTLARALANPDAGRVVSKWLRVLPLVAVVVSFLGAVSGHEEPTLVAAVGAIVLYGLSVWFVFPAMRLRQLSRFHAGSIVEVWLGESTPHGTTVHWLSR